MLISESIKVNAATVPKIYYSVDNSSIKIGDTFNIYVNCENINDLYGASVDFKYDKTMLQILDITEGDVFKKSSKLYNPVVKTSIPDTTGIVSIGLAMQGDVAGFNGTGKLFVIKAKALKLGTISLKTTNDSSQLGTNGLNMCIKLADATTGGKITGVTYETKNMSINTPFYISSLKSDKTSPVALGNTIKFTTVASGSSNILYKFVSVSNGKTTLLKDFGASNYTSFKPSTSASYKIIAYARNVTTGSIISKELNIVVNVPFTITSLTSDKASPVALGNTIKFTTVASGSSNILYKFVSVSNGKISLLKDFGASNYTSFKPVNSASYKIFAYAKNVTTGSTISKELNLVISN